MIPFKLITFRSISLISRTINTEMRRPKICAPLTSLVDKKIEIKIEGLEPHERVTLQAKQNGDSGERYYSLSHFIADREGKVDVASQPSLGEFYQGVDPMGFIWSMKPEPGQRKGTRLFKKEVTKPFLVELEVYEGHVIDNGRGSALCHLVIERGFMAEGVRRIPIRQEGVVGTLFLPSGNGKFPGILDMFGSIGGCIETKASLLASHGFAALALAYMDFEGLPKLEDLALEYFINAKNWLQNHHQVLPGGIGIMGVSKGSDIAMLLASQSPDLRALICIAPFYGIQYSPILYKGQEITTHVPLRSECAVVEEDGSWNAQCCYPDNWAGDITKNPYVTQVENIHYPVMFVCGLDDRSSKVEESVEKLMDRAKASGKGMEQLTVLKYKGAGHLIEPPYSPHCFMSYHGMLRMYLAWGGKPKEHAVAQEDSWARILDFFAKNLPQHRPATSKL